MQVMRWSSVPTWLKFFLTWMEAEFRRVTNHGKWQGQDQWSGQWRGEWQQLVVVVRAVAGAFIMKRLPLRVLAQVLYDLLERKEIQLATMLYDATALLAQQSKRGAEIMELVSAALLAQERKRKLH